HTQKVRQTLLDRVKGERQPRASVFRFYVEQEVRSIEPQLEELRRSARRAPDAETSWRRRSNSNSVSAEVHLHLQVLDEIRRQRLRDEMRDWPPSRVYRAYLDAVDDADEQSRSTLIRLVEDQHAAGWSGKKPEGNVELAAAHELRKLIDVE